MPVIPAVNEQAQSGVFKRKMKKKYLFTDVHFQKTRQTAVPSE